MNSLQLWLAIVGGLVLAGVVGHGAWQTRRASGGKSRPVPAAPDAPMPAPAPVAAPPAAPVYQEPSFDDDIATTQPLALDEMRHKSDAQAVEERLTAVPPALGQPPRRQVVVPRIDALIDAIAVIAPERPLLGDVVLAHMPPSRRAGGKPFFVEGLEARTQEWEPPLAGHTYTELQAGLQLVNRVGPVNEIEYSEFVQKIQTCADTLGAEVDFPDMLEVVARARALDHIAVHHDAQLAMRLHARHGANWPMSWVQQHAARHGFVSGPRPGRLILPGRGEGAPAVLALVFDPQAALAEDPQGVWVSEMSLVFDVPQTPQSEEPFNAWCAAGQALSISLDADLTDDDGNALNAESFKLIREDLHGLYTKLAEFDLPAGSAATRRLFS